MVVIQHLLEFEPEIPVDIAEKFSETIEDCFMTIEEDGFTCSDEFKLSFIKGMAAGLRSGRVS